jgi:hypothetical protein
MSDAAALERRYRRLLAWFPAQHRSIYGEEMIGVLLASAPEGRDRPAPGDVADLVSSGLRARLRNWSGAGKVDPKWADALAAYTVAAPILMIGLLSFQVYLAILNFNQRFQFPSLPGEPSYLDQLIILLLLDGTAIAAVLALAICPWLLRRDHHLAVGLISGTAALLGLVATVSVDVGLPQYHVFQVGFTAFYLLELLAVAISPDPGRGWRVLTGKGLIIIGLVLTVAIAAESTVQWVLPDSLSINRDAIELAALAVGLALIMIFGSDAHKRLLALLAVPGYPLLGYSYVSSDLLFNSEHGVLVRFLYLPTLTTAALVALAIWQASRKSRAAG